MADPVVWDMRRPARATITILLTTIIARYRGFTIEYALDRLGIDDAVLLLETEAEAVRIEGGQAKAVVVRNAEGSVEIGADVVALASNATNNVLLMERSGISAPALGRFLNEQQAVFVDVETDFDGYLGGTSITGHGYDLYDGPHRRESAAVLMENINAPATFRTERGHWLQRVQLKLIAEDLPQERNRIREGENGRPHYVWHGHDDYSTRGLERAIAQLPHLLPITVEDVIVRAFSDTESHIQGTHRMGRDPQTAVVDDRLGVHGVSGLLALGSGAFPSCPPANPTLTLSALSLRAGRLL